MHGTWGSDASFRLGHSMNPAGKQVRISGGASGAVSYTHLRAHETVLDIVCRLLLEKKKQNNNTTHTTHTHHTTATSDTIPPNSSRNTTLDQLAISETQTNMSP